MMSFTSRPISRRTVLRGAGALLALPLLEAMTPRRALGAAAAAQPPVRMGIFSVTGGTVIESWKPETAGPLAKLPSILRSLEPLKDELLVVSGLAQGGRSDGLNGHEHCAYLHLTCAETAKREGGKPFADISVDQFAAQRLGKDTFLPSLELGLNNNQYSFRSPNVTVPFEGNPRLVFERMFRSRKPVVPNWSRRATTPAPAAVADSQSNGERGVIDLVLDQAHGLRRKLGTADQYKLDEYLESVHSVEQRIAFVETRHRQEVLDLAAPGPSQLRLPANLPAEGIPIWKIAQPINDDPEKHADYIRLLAELMVLAFQTDTTRVVTLAAGSDESLFPGVVTVGYERHCHTIEHQGNAGRPEDADPIAREACRQIHAWYTQLFAEMLTRMKQIDEGGSSLLDNSLILYTSYMSNGGHGLEDYPALLAGRAGGALKPGRHLVYDKQAPFANLYVEMLNLMGLETRSFGDALTSRFAGSYNGRLPGMLG
jgi:hypothetical protein